MVARARKALIQRTTLTEQTRDQGGALFATSVMVAVTANTGVPADGVSIQQWEALQSIGRRRPRFRGPGQSCSCSAERPALSQARSTPATQPSMVGFARTSNTVQCRFQLVTARSTPSSSRRPRSPSRPARQEPPHHRVTPVNTLVDRPPIFITISCSGLPDLANCNFTPENVEIAPQPVARPGVTSTMVIQTYAANTTSLSPPSLPGKGSSSDRLGVSATRRSGPGRFRLGSAPQTLA